jgi:hypothetical protein
LSQLIHGGSGEILDALLAKHFPPTEREAKRKRIAGIVGYANGSAKSAGRAELHAVLRARFAARDDLADLVRDADFKTFVSLRPAELRS